jgi:hypothetical protein
MDDSLVTYRIRVPRAAENRLVTLEVFDGDLRVSFSQKQLDGTAAAALWTVDTQLPAGRLVMIATLYGTDGVIERARHVLIVHSRAGL